MKTLYYKIKMRIHKNFYNEGFIKVERNKEQKIEMFGVLTDDIFIGEENDGKIWFNYFVCNCKEKSFDEAFEFSIKLKDFKLPQIFEVMYENGNKLIITIEEKIKDQLKKEECEKIIKETINVFENESE